MKLPAIPPPLADGVEMFDGIDFAGYCARGMAAPPCQIKPEVVTVAERPN
jgi:hypothetical protein